MKGEKKRWPTLGWQVRQGVLFKEKEGRFFSGDPIGKGRIWGRKENQFHGTKEKDSTLQSVGYHFYILERKKGGEVTPLWEIIKKREKPAKL